MSNENKPSTEQPAPATVGSRKPDAPQKDEDPYESEEYQKVRRTLNLRMAVRPLPFAPLTG
jgi:hypothetical protein